MRHGRIVGWAVAALVLAGSGWGLAGTVPPGGLDRAKVVYRWTIDSQDQEGVLAPQSQDRGLARSGDRPSPGLRLDTKASIKMIPVGLAIPAEDPAYIVFKATATRPGRLVVHLQPAEIPADMKDKVQKEDWADPNRRYDMRALVSLEPGEWRQYAIDLNRGVFETITREKDLYDLAGLKIKAIGFAINEPADADQEVQVSDVRIVALDAVGRQGYLQAQMDQLRAPLEVMGSHSPIAVYWRPIVSELNMAVIGFDPGASLAEWRALSGRIDTLILASHKWSLARGRAQAYLIGTETSLRRVSGRNALHAFRGRIGTTVQLDAAGNEYESFQVVLMPLVGDLRGVTVRCGDLKAAEGKASIPASNIAFYHQIEQYIQPSLRTADEQVGWTPDALLPVTGPFDVKNVETKALWVTVHVPEGTPAGDYAGAIAIKPAGDSPERSVNLQVKVHGLAIPKVGQFRTQGHFAVQTLQEWYGEKYGPEVRKAFYRLLVEHRFSPTSQYSRMLSPVEEDIPWVMREGGNVIVIGGYHTKPLEPERIDGWYDWLVKNGYIEKALIYIGDETDQYEAIREKSRTIRENWPKLRIMVGGSKPRPELIGYVDIWDPITSGGNIYDFDAKGSREAQARGEEMFWYTCIGPRQPYANCCNDDPLTAIRALWWQTWKYGITGFEYWALNQWGLNMPLSKGEKPWPASRTDEWNPRSYAWCNGDGLMVYPGPDGQPLSCNRFSVMRDAIEDWEVLFQLQRAVDLAGKAPATRKADTDDEDESQSLVQRAKALLDVPAEITADLTHWSEDPQVYFKHRREAYELLAALRTRLGPERVDAFTARWIADRDRWMQERFEERVKGMK